MPRRRKLLIVGAVLSAGAFAGGAYAATTSNTSPRQAFLNDVAGRLHVTPQQLSSAIKGATEDQLQAAVRAGKLTQAQANAIEKRIREGAVGPGPVGPLFGPRLQRRVFLRGGELGSAARYIGISSAELFEQLGAGKSLAQLATAHGKSVSGLENALIAGERTQLDRLRQHGMITSAQQQKILGRIQSKISALVNRKGFGSRLGSVPGFRQGLAPRFGEGPVPRFGPLPGPPPAAGGWRGGTRMGPSSATPPGPAPLS